MNSKPAVERKRTDPESEILVDELEPSVAALHEPAAPVAVAVAVPAQAVPEKDFTTSVCAWAVATRTANKINDAERDISTDGCL